MDNQPLHELDDIFSDYEIYIKKQEGAYFAGIREFEGCYADARTPEGAVLKLRSAMKSWIESRREAGLKIPSPKGPRP